VAQYLASKEAGQREAGQKLANYSQQSLHAHIRFGEKWKPCSKRHKYENENGVLSKGGKIKAKKKRRERGLKNGQNQCERK